jgi:hypothetical protein
MNDDVPEEALEDNQEEEEEEEEEEEVKLDNSDQVE